MNSCSYLPKDIFDKIQIQVLKKLFHKKIKHRHKKHAGAHVGCQLGGLFGQLMWYNPTGILEYLDSETVRVLGIGVTIMIGVFFLAKQQKWC